ASSPEDMRVHVDAFFAALANDFNTPAARTAMFEWIREANRRGSGVGDADLVEMLDVLGLSALLAEPAAGELAGGDPEALALVAEREQARRDGDFETADRLRLQLHERGWELRDGPEGPQLIASSKR